MTQGAEEITEEPAPFRAARERNDKDEMRRLLNEMDESQQRRQLFNAAKHSFMSVLEIFSEPGMMSLDTPWPSGNNTPLMQAVMKDQREVIRFLLSKNCNLAHRNDTGYTPLHNAASCAKEFETVMVLALAGADFNAVNVEGDTPRDAAAGWRRRPEMVKWLIEAEQVQHQRKRERREEEIEQDASVAHTGVVAKPMRTLRFKNPQNRFLFAR